MQKLEFGQIVNTFAIKGELKVKPFVDNVEQFDRLKKVYIKNKEYEIEYVKYHKGMVLLKLKGVNTIEEAEKLKNSYLEIEREDIEKLSKGTYYIVDLLGLDVYKDTGELLGKLEDIYNTGSNDIYVVKNELGKQLLLPAIADVIKQINIEEKKIIVHILDGLE